MTSIDQGEIAKFEAMAAEWWDPKGKLRPLHMMNPVRLDYLTAQIAAEFGRDLRGARPFGDLRVLDIGCGGGLVAEPMAPPALVDPCYLVFEDGKAASPQ